VSRWGIMMGDGKIIADGYDSQWSAVLALGEIRYAGNVDAILVEWMDFDWEEQK
jgi:hypothetical protein